MRFRYLRNGSLRIRILRENKKAGGNGAYIKRPRRVVEISAVKPQHGGIAAIQIGSIHCPETQHYLSFVFERGTEAVGLSAVKNKEENRAVRSLPDCRTRIERINPIRENTGRRVNTLTVLNQDGAVAGTFFDILCCELLHMLKAQVKNSLCINPGKTLAHTGPAAVNFTVADDGMLRNTAVSCAALIHEASPINAGNSAELLSILCNGITSGIEPIRAAAKNNTGRIEHDEHISCTCFPRHGNENKPIPIVICISPGIRISLSRHR